MYCGDLKQSTAVTVPLGPHVDATDGFTAETALTVNQAAVRLRKNGGAAAQVNESTTAPHDENGYYRKALNTTDTNTLGILQISTHISGARPVVHSFRILPAWQYDAMYSTTPTITVDQFVTTKGTELRNDSASGVGLKIQGPSDGSGFGMLVQGDQTALASVPASGTGNLGSAAGAGLIVISRTTAVSGGNAAWFHNATNDGAGVYIYGHDSCAGIHCDGGSGAPAMRIWGGGRHFASAAGEGIDIKSGSTSGTGLTITGTTTGTNFGTVSVGTVSAGDINLGSTSSPGTLTAHGGIIGSQSHKRYTVSAVGSNTVSVRFTATALNTGARTPENDAFVGCLIAPRTTSLNNLAPVAPSLITGYTFVADDPLYYPYGPGTGTFTVSSNWSTTYPPVLNRFIDILPGNNEIAVAIQEVTDQLIAAQTEPTSAPASNATPLEKLAWIAMIARNKIVQTENTQTIRNADDDADVASADLTRNGTEFTRGSFS